MLSITEKKWLIRKSTLDLRGNVGEASQLIKTFLKNFYYFQKWREKQQFCCMMAGKNWL